MKVCAKKYLANELFTEDGDASAHLEPDVLLGDVVGGPGELPEGGLEIEAFQDFDCLSAEGDVGEGSVGVCDMVWPGWWAVVEGDHIAR